MPRCVLITHKRAPSLASAPSGQKLVVISTYFTDLDRYLELTEKVLICARKDR